MRAVAYQMQVKIYGELSAATKRRLREISELTVLRQPIRLVFFKKIDAVGKQRDRANDQGDRELDAEIAQVQDGDENDGLAGIFPVKRESTGNFR